MRESLLNKVHGKAEQFQVFLQAEEDSSRSAHQAFITVSMDERKRMQHAIYVVLQLLE